jgi:hypothetical protein
MLIPPYYNCLKVRSLMFIVFQVMIINAVKDVASALSDLISATKNASGKSVSDPAMLTLKESAKVSTGHTYKQCSAFCLL